MNIKKDDFDRAVRAAVNGLYTKTVPDMEEALAEILEILDSNIAALFQDDEEAAHARVNFEQPGEEDEEIVHDTYLPEDFDD